jgi:quinol monooxygenase YgiN
VKTALKVTVIARFRVVAGGEEHAKRAAAAVIEATRLEEGCLNYDLHQSATDPCDFMFHENWSSRADLDRHSSSAHVAAWREAVGTVLDGQFDITLWHEL